MIGNITQFVQGRGSVDGDQLNTFIQGGFNDTSLLNTVGKTGMVVMSQGSTEPGVGTARFYYWNDTAVAGSGVIVPTGAANGGWVKLTLG